MASMGKNKRKNNFNFAQFSEVLKMHQQISEHLLQLPLLKIGCRASLPGRTNRHNADINNTALFCMLLGDTLIEYNLNYYKSVWWKTACFTDTDLFQKKFNLVSFYNTLAVSKLLDKKKKNAAEAKYYPINTYRTKI